MNKIRNIIKTDIIALNGCKKNPVLPIIIMDLGFCIFSFAISPVYVIMAQLLLGVMEVSLLFGNESKIRSMKLYSVLPVQKKDVVNARFLYGTGLFLFSSVITYFITLPMAVFDFNLVNLTDISDSVSILKVLASKINGCSQVAVFNILYAFSFSFGLVWFVRSLRIALANPSVFSSRVTMSGKKEKRAVLVAFAMLVIMVVLIASEAGGYVLSAVYVVFAVIAQLAGVLNGMLLISLMLICALFIAGYNYLCALLEYENKEI